MAGARLGPGLDFERATAVRLGERRFGHRQDQRTRWGLLRPDDDAGQQQRNQEERHTSGDGGPPPGPGEQREASGRQWRHAPEARRVAMAPFTARLTRPPANGPSFDSGCAEASINQSNLVTK